MTEYTVILANGDFPSSPEALSALAHARRVVCCDGAAVAYWQYAHALPTCVIGDLDSLDAAERQRFAAVLHHITEQETNDLAKAFRFCLEQGWRDIVILGATGKREDHTLGNLAHLADFALQCPAIRLVTDTGVFSVMNHSGELETTPGQQVSIFTLDTSTAITSTGLKYPLDNLTPTRWWNATLNEALDSRVTLAFTPGHQLLIFRETPRP